MAGCVLMTVLTMLSLRAPTLVLGLPQPPVKTMTEKLGAEDMALLVRHAAAEQTRFLTRKWQQAEFFLAVALAACLFFGTQRRILPLVLCGVMVMLVAFQFVGVSPELTYRGRETDFPPGNTAIGSVTRYLLLEQVYFGSEIMKRLAGAILASYLFVFRTGRRRAKEVHAIDDPDDRHVDG